ncbi:MAG: hypothetical protein ACKOW5_07600, partial [Actinomycetales bacterium]
MSRYQPAEATLRTSLPASPRQRGATYWRELDWILLAAALGVTAFGAVLVWSASRADMALESDPQSYLKRHLINVAIALVLGFVVSRLN